MEGEMTALRLRRRLFHTLLAVLCAAGIAKHPAWAGGSNYGISPGALQQIAGKVREWPVPTPEFARDPAPAPDGAIYIAVMHGNRIARFDPGKQAFSEWVLPENARPHGLVVDAQGIVWYTGNGNGSIGRLDPVSGEVREYRTPSGGDPHTIVIDEQGQLWFTVQHGQRVVRLDPGSGQFTEYPSSGNPYGLAIDAQGVVWFCRVRGDKLGWIDARSGQTGEIDTGPGSAPRRIAAAPNGELWVAYYGNGKLARLDPRAKRIVETWDLPKEGGREAYAVTVDGAGRVWVNGIDSDTVSVFDPVSERFRVIHLPSKNIGIRKAIIDAQGRYWYMGSHNGRLGMVE
jgi:virginiamycin B lyase